MQAGPHDEESERLAALRRYDILDTLPEGEFEDIVKVVSAICEAPVSLISLVDEGRQWFKAEIGFGLRETPLSASICAHAILQHDLFVVPDALEDPRFSDNPLVAGSPHVRFYAGAILKTPEGMPLGTLCVLDYKPRDLTANQKALLNLMASMIMKLFEARRNAASERTARETAEQLAKENETLAREGDHRVMNSLNLVSSVLTLQSRMTTIEDTRIQLDDARRRVHAIATVHRQLHMAGSLEDIDTEEFLTRLCAGLHENAPANVGPITVSAHSSRMPSEKASTLGLIVAELVANSFKHAFPDGRTGKLSMTFVTGSEGWILSVADNGVGVPDNFDPRQSKGIGMRVILALVKRLDAQLVIQSDASSTMFTVTTAPRV